MANVAHTKKLLFAGWSDEAISAYLQTPVEYVRLTREGKANPSIPWPNGKTGSLEQAKE